VERVPKLGGVVDNEEVLAAFGEFLGGDELVSIIIRGFGREPLVAAVREFAEAIKPITLAHATSQQMTIFVRQRSQVEAGRNPLEQRMQKQRAQLRRLTYEAAFFAFVQFRRKALPKKPKLR
jgi:hypothetical protein